MMKYIRKLASAFPLLLALNGCMAQVGEPNDSAESSLDTASESLVVLPEVAFETFTDPAGIGTAGRYETKRLIRTASQYRQMFGHPAPASVNFLAGDQVIFYSAGLKPTAGYTASVLRVERTSLVLRIATRLESPGESCVNAQARTIPYVLAKVRVGPAAYLGHFSATEKVTVDCGVVGPFCGGIAGIACPGEGSCVDDTRDDCDPRQGGADCGGVCECNVLGLCGPGSTWDASPDVCACVPVEVNPCALVLCPGNSICRVIDGEAVCTPFLRDPCANFDCPLGQVCTAPADRPYCIRDPRSAP